MSPENAAAVLYGAKDLRIISRSAPKPGKGEALVRVKATGLCGSDLHYYNHGANGPFVVRDPMALGHESAGEIAALGEGCEGLKVGDRVAIEAGQNCRECKQCKLGKYNLCSNMRFASSAKVYPHQDGLLQTFVAHPARLLYKLPENVSLEQASLVEPLSVVLNAAQRSNLAPGARVLVLGAGAVGVLACALARALGAAHVTVADINEARLEFATRGKRFADVSYKIDTSKPRPASPQESIDAAKALATELVDRSVQDSSVGDEASAGFDIVFECSGVESCMQTAVFAAAPGGKAVYVGMGTSTATLPTSAAFIREVDLIGVFRYANTYPSAIALFAAGKLDGVDELVTHRFPLDKAADAFELLRKGADEQGKMAVKVMIGDY